jgi:hypothetical protein
VSKWQEYWTPEEYADMRENMTSAELEEEMRMRRRKAESIRAARQMGLDDGEAAVMRVREMMVMHDARAGESQAPSAVVEKVDDEPPF